MALKQGSFNFDFPDTPSNEEEKKVSAETTSPAAIEVVQTEPVEIDIQTPPKTKKTTRGRMKISEMDARVELLNIPEDEILFQKSY